MKKPSKLFAKSTWSFIRERVVSRVNKAVWSWGRDKVLGDSWAEVRNRTGLVPLIKGVIEDGMRAKKN